MPCCIKAIEVMKPILSNYEIKLCNQKTDKTVLKLIKSLLINEIVTDRQEEFFVGVESKKFPSGQKVQGKDGMVGQLYKFIQDHYHSQKVAVVVNTNGWNSSVGTLIQQSLIDIINPLCEIDLPVIDYNDKLQIEDNDVNQALKSYEKFVRSKGRNRRNRLQNYELFDFKSHPVFIKESLPSYDRFIDLKFNEKTTEILLSEKQDFYALMKLQKTHKYDTSDLIFCADLNEYLYCDPSNKQSFLDMFADRMVAVCTSNDLDKLQEDDSDDENQISLYNTKSSIRSKFVDFEHVREKSVGFEPIAFGYVQDITEQVIKIVHKDIELDIDASKQQLIITL